MTIEEIKALDDEALFKLSLERGGKHNCYTRDALKAQSVYNERRGFCYRTRNSTNLGKTDRSYYSDLHY